MELSDEGDDAMGAISAETIKSLADIPPPPRIGERCAHSPTIRCPRCFEEWEQAVLRYIGKTREELELAEAGAAAGAQAAGGETDAERAGRFTETAGVGANVLDLGAVRKAFGQRQQVLRYQEKAYIRGLSMSAGVTGFMQRLFQTTEYALGFAMRLYGRVQHPDPNDLQSAALMVEWAFLPMQVTVAGVVMLKEDQESLRKSHAADFVAQRLGLVPVGEVICRKKGRAFIFSASELGSAAERAVALSEGVGRCDMKHYCLVDCSIDSAARTIELVPYAPSQQLLGLIKAGMLLPPEQNDPPNQLRFKEKQVVERTTSELVETVLLLKPVALTQHPAEATALACSIMSWDFPPYMGVTNPTIQDLKTHMNRTRGKPAWERFADPNLLVYLTDLFSNDELAAIIDGVARHKGAPAFANAMDMIASTIACVDA